MLNVWILILATHIVPSNVSNIRLSDYAIGIFPTLRTRKGLKKSIKKGAVWIDGQVANTGRWVTSGQVIQLIELDEKPPKIYRLSLEIVHEDDVMAVVNKPAGVVVSGNQFRTIQNALSYNLTASKSIDALKWAKPAHRLDHATSGLLLIAKTKQVRVELGRQFEQGEIRKQYQAVVVGKLPSKGTFNQMIADKSALTHFELVQSVASLRNGYLSLVNLYPVTGRTHQIRIHLASAGHPIVGDKLYGKEGMILKHKGLFLCAVRLAFQHPLTKEDMNFTIKPPAKFTTFMKREELRWGKWNEKI